MSYNISLKISPKHSSHQHRWGEYHMALSMKREFEKVGHMVSIHIRPDWYNSMEDQHISIVLRGAYFYKPNPRHINIMWNISHPDHVSTEEYNQYDYVLIASDYWTSKLKDKLTVPVESMLQFTDLSLFYKNREISRSEDQKHEILFVGNTKNRHRKIVEDILPTERALAIYGSGWNKGIYRRYFCGTYIPNEELSKFYASSGILLNDHWEDMRDKGFINNRTFDGLASGAFIISDPVHSIEETFQNSVAIYRSPGELKELIDFYLSNPELRREKAKVGQQIVCEYHTCSNRVARLLKIISSLYKGR